MGLAGSAAFKSGFARSCVALSLVAACAASAFAQSGRPVSVETGQFGDVPVEMISVEVAGEAHAFAAGKEFVTTGSFDAPEDWLRGFALRVRNKSDKALVFAHFTGALSVGGPGEIPMGIDLRFGCELDESALTGREPLGEAARLPAGDMADVRWSGAEMAALEKFLSTKRAPADYRQMRVELREARFEDGTAWAGGRLYRIDPTDPRKWTPLDGRPLVGSVAPAVLKPGERLIEVSSFKRPSDEQVLTISEIRIAGQPITPGQPFPAGEDWLRTLTVRVKNVSQKPMTYVQINGGLPEATYHSGGIGFFIQYGRHKPFNGVAVADVKPLAPGEETELTFTEESYERNLSFAQKSSGLASFSRLRIGGAQVEFADGTSALVLNLSPAQKQGATDKK